MNFLKHFSAPDFVEPITDKNEIKAKYKHFRVRIFYACFIGYIVFHLIKKNLAVAMPDMAAALGYTNTELGVLGASLYLTYGFGKFVNGILSDRSDVRKFMPTALLVSAIANLCFLASAYFITPGQFTFFGLPTTSMLLWLLVFFWGANGWFQSGGFPPIAKSMAFWYSTSERGRIWSLWSTSHQLGILASFQVSNWSIQYLGWKGAFLVPSILSILCAIWLYDRLRDRPETIGLPDIEVYKQEPDDVCEESCADDNRSYLQIYKESILFNKIMWLLAIAFVFVYLIRFGTEDWLIKFLVEHKNNSLTMATNKLSTLAFCGMLGVISSGTLSDLVFKGKRAFVNIIYLLGVIVSILGIWLTPPGMNWLDFVFAGLIGFFTGGPQMLIGGLCPIEASSKKVAAASTGFVGVFGYLGAVLSSVGTGIMIDKFSWQGAIYLWIGAAIICVAICLFLLKDEYSRKHSCHE